MSGSEARFVGSIPDIYHRHLGPLLFEPYAADLVARLDPRAAHVLELAAGTGIVTRRLRERLPAAARLVASDLNEPMLQVAQSQIGPAQGIEWRQADATALPFPDESFDAVVCQFGWMFFPDKPRAAREARRVAKPGGQLLLNVWDSLAHDPLGRIADETIAGFFPQDPPDFYKIPFGYHDKGVMRALLEDAGWSGVKIETLPLVAEAPSAEHAAIGLVRGNPVLLAIRERGSAEPDAIVAALAAALGKEFGDRPLRVPMQAHVVEARRG
jgi:SAM-dependent methyltransferase